MGTLFRMRYDDSVTNDAVTSENVTKTKAFGVRTQ